jgi:hypothetical protein
MKQTMIKLIQSAIVLSAAIAGLAQAEDAGRAVFVSGKVDIAGKNLVLDTVVAEGAEISTGADGYVYIKTIDNGFFILRPNSRARIVAYHVDQKNPANTHIKLELINGVARSISGDAVKLARQNFRFNTPVAAIGVRGTDFTVFTNHETSRVTVLSGGVVVSGFVSGCAPQGNGPCEGGASTELFARQQGQLLQITKDQVKPQLIQSNGAAPDMVAPPRPDEPAVKPAAAASTPAPAVASAAPPASSDINLDPQKSNGLQQAIAAPLPVVPTPVIPVLPVIPPADPSVTNTILWGRWAVVLGQAASLDTKKQADAQNKSVAMNSYFGIFQSAASEWQVPTAGKMGFALKNSEAYLKDETKNLLSLASIENAKLQIDFANASFSTGFDLVSNSERFSLQSQGAVSTDGKLIGNGQYNYPTNMAVSGLVTAEKGGVAAYLFQSRLDANRLAYGITYWGK